MELSRRDGEGERREDGGKERVRQETQKKGILGAVFQIFFKWCSERL